MTDGLTVRVDAGQVLAFAGACQAAPGIVADEMAVAMTGAVADVEGAAKQIVAAEAHDTGALANSLTGSPPQPFAGGVRGIVETNLDYAATIHDGREPGRPMPPAGALLPWMRRHNIDERYEFVIRRRIARYGTKGTFFLRRALSDQEASIRRRFALVPGRVAARLGLR